MLVTWREMSKKEFNVWRMEGRIEEINLLQKINLPIAQTTGAISPHFISGDHYFIWSETRTNKCSVCPWSRKDHMQKLFWGTHNLTTNPGFRLSAIQNVENMQFVQPSLHNLKGTVSRFLESVDEPWMAPNRLHFLRCFRGWQKDTLWLTMHSWQGQKPVNGLHQDRVSHGASHVR